MECEDSGPGPGHRRLSCSGIPRVYKDVWKPVIGEKLHAEQEPDNAVDKFAMKVVKKQRERPAKSVQVTRCYTYS